MATPKRTSSTIYQHMPETNNGTVTSWIPITTTWTPASGCAKSIWSYKSGNMLAAWDPGYGLSVDKGLRCWPPEGTSWWNADRLGANSQTDISIGPITCPQAYYTATTTLKDKSSTFVACCPSGYRFTKVFNAGGIGECLSDLRPGQIMTYAIRNSVQNWITISTSITVSTQMAAVQFNGWQFKQELLTPTTVMNSTITSSAAASPAKSELATGAEGGIGVGVAVGIIAILVMVGYWIIKQRRKARSLAYTTTNLYDQEPVEVDGNFHIPELAAKKEPQELQSHSLVYELPER